MKRELIKRVVEHAVERNIISLEDCALTKEERQVEIVEVIKDSIEEANKMAIEALVNGFGEFIFEVAEYTTLDNSTGEQRHLTLDEMAHCIHGEYWRIRCEVDDIINE